MVASNDREASFDGVAGDESAIPKAAGAEKSRIRARMRCLERVFRGAGRPLPMQR